jgi:hypothetical protein
MNEISQGRTPNTLLIFTTLVTRVPRNPMPSRSLLHAEKTTLPLNEEQIGLLLAAIARAAHLDLKIDCLNKDLEQIAGGVLDDRAAADLRDRLQRELAAAGAG